MDPTDFFSDLVAKHRQEQRPTRGDLRDLIKLCASRQQAVRETALTLLLQPPVIDETAYYQWLMAALQETTPRINQLPEALVQRLFEILGFLKVVPEDPAARQFLHRLLTNPPKTAIIRLLEKPLTLRPMLPHLTVRSLNYLHHGSRTQFRRHWRLLRRWLLSAPGPQSFSRLTFADLGPLWRRQQGARRHPHRKGRWLRIGRPLLHFDGAPADSFAAPFHQCYWGGYSSATARYWEALLLSQAQELRSVNRLALQVSATTRRVVLSWHNATLAAMSGWGFPHLQQQFPSRSLWRSFQQSVRARVREMGRAHDTGEGALGLLFQLWEKRLVRPKIQHALWESCIRMRFDRQHESQWDKDLRAARAWLDTDQVRAICEGRSYGWHGTVSPHQTLRMDQIITWHRQRCAVWKEGFFLLAALIREGQRLMDTGDLPHFVLPWIDKFFISSLREQDLEYLPALLHWMEGMSGQPLVLFWEDTVHARTPSFQLALERLRKRGTPYRGIGVFDKGGSERSRAVEIICREHSVMHLFALRPWADTHNPCSFQQALHNLDYAALRAYDSSWKDNLCFIYTGTQVFPLLSVQCDMEAFPAWIAVKGRKVPFGAYFRNGLRRHVLGEVTALEDELSVRYALWANLC